MADLSKSGTPTVVLASLMLLTLSLLAAVTTPTQAGAQSEPDPIRVRVSGSNGDETFQVLADAVLLGEYVAGQEWSIVSVDAPAGTSVRDLEVRFINDAFEPGVFDRNLFVDYLELDGERFEGESESTYSTGAWTQAEGCTSGFSESEAVPCNGSLFFDREALVLRAKGATGEERIEIAANGWVLSDHVLGSEWEQVRVPVPFGFDPDLVSVELTNDKFDPSNQYADRNVEIDWMQLGDELIQAESPLVYSTGSWDSSTGCEPGRKSTQVINCDGGLQFLFLEAEDTVVRANVRGQTGTEKFELRHGDEVLVSETASQAWTEFVSVVNGPVSETVRVSFLNDLFVGGYDRNLEVDWIEIGYTVLESESDTTVSTGTWTSENGCAEGSWQSEVLHCNGSLVFTPDQAMVNNDAVVLADGAESTNDSTVRAELVAPQGMQPTEMRISTGSVENSAWLSFRETTNVEFTDGDGIKRVSVQFRDAKGNVTPVFYDEILLDRSPPEVEIESISDGERIDLGEDGTQTGSFPLAGTVAEDVQTVLVRAGGEEVEVPVDNGSFELEATAPESGTHSYEVVSRDELGNESVETVTIDVTVAGPEETLFQPELILIETLDQDVVSFDAESGMISFDGDKTEIAEPGAILSVAPNEHMPLGHLGRVVEATATEGGTVVRTEPAVLEEAFRQLDLEIGELDEDLGEPGEDLGGLVEAESFDLTPGAITPRQSGPSVSSQDLGNSVSRTVSLNSTIVSGNNASLRTEGSLTASLYAKGSLDLNCRWFRCNPKWSLVLSGTARGQIEVIANAKGSIEGSKTLFTGPVGSPVQVGPVTVTVRGEVTVSGRASGQAEVRSGKISGNAYGRISVVNNNASATGQIRGGLSSQPSATASASISVSASVALGLYAWDAVGGEVTAKIGPRLELRQNNNEVRGSVYMDSSVTGEARLQVPVIGNTIANYGPKTIISDSVFLKSFFYNVPQPTTTTTTVPGPGPTTTTTVPGGGSTTSTTTTIVDSGGPMRVSFIENPFVCDGQTRNLGTISGARSGERITFSSPTLGSLIPGTANNTGALTMIWTCDPQGAGASHTVTARGERSGRTVTFVVTQRATPTTQGLSVSFTENPFRCDGGVRQFGRVSGAAAGETITFTSPSLGELLPGTADGNGGVNIQWVCGPPGVGTTWTVNARGTTTGRTVSFQVTGR